MESNNEQSFMLAIADVISPDKKIKITLDMLKKELISKLDEKLFKSLNKGLLEFVFNINDKKPIENFKEFIMSSDTKIDETFMWDFLTRPDIIEPSGINLIIFEGSKIMCPVSEECSEFFDIDKPTFILYKINEYYEPIYKLEKYSKNVIEKTRFTKDITFINDIIKLIQQNCQNKELEWNIILKENKKLYDIQYDCSYSDENSYLETIKFFKPKVQVMDTYNRMIGILVDYKKYKNIFIPVRPGSIDVDLDIIDSYDLHNYEKTYEALLLIEKETKLPIGPRYKVLLFNELKKIVGIITNTGRLLPVQKTLDTLVKKGKYNLPSRVQTLFLDINDKIATDILEEDDRLKLIKELEYETETYERIRFELSMKDKKIKEKIKDIIISDKSLDDKRENMYNLLKPIIKSMIYLNNKKPNLKKYKTPNERTLCSTSVGKDPHCIKVGSTYKINVPKINMMRRENNLDYILSKIIRRIM